MLRRRSTGCKPEIPGLCNLSVGRKRFNTDSVELCLWILLVFLLLYIYLPDALNPIFGTPAPIKTKGFSPHQQESDARKNSLTSLSMQVVHGGEDKIHAVLADIQNSKQLVIPKEFRKPPSTMPEMGNSRHFVTEQNKLKKRDRNSLSLKVRCTAPFPIEFVYKGYGRPTFGGITSEKKKMLVGDYGSVHIFIATLDFAKDHLEERDTGKYICQSIGERAPHISESLEIFHGNSDIKRKGEIDVFVPGEIALLPKDIWVGENDKLSGHMRNLAQVIMIHHDVAVDGKEITVPCSVSDPTIKVSLYRMEGKTYYLEKEGGDDNGLVTYDNIYGFRIPVEMAKGWSERNLICRAHQGEIMKEIRYQIELRGWDSRVSPALNQVIVPSDQLPIQVFRCEAEEPLTVKCLDGPPINVAYGEPTANGRIYSATFIATPTQISGESPMARFECSRKRNGEVIHTWEWRQTSVSDGRKPDFSYDENRKELSCCMKHFKSRLVFEACSTMLECQVRASLLHKTTTSDGSNAEAREGQTELGPPNHDDNNGCAAWSLPKEFQAGLVMCTQLKNNSFSDHSRNMELPPVLFRWNDDVVFIRDGVCSKPLDQLMKMRITTGADVIGQGHSTNYKQIECTASAMIFARGFRWKIFTWDNKVFEDVQLKSGWGNKYGSAGVVTYKEDYQPQTGVYYGVLILKVASYVQPLLKIHSKEGAVAHLEMKDKIIKISCEIALWNDTNIWIAAFVNKSFLN